MVLAHSTHRAGGSTAALAVGARSEITDVVDRMTRRVHQTLRPDPTASSVTASTSLPPGAKATTGGHVTGADSVGGLAANRRHATHDYRACRAGSPSQITPAPPPSATSATATMCWSAKASAWASPHAQASPTTWSTPLPRTGS
jgi:hypothetical protein